MITNINITPNNILSWPLHGHDYLEIMYYLEGEGFLKTDSSKIPFSPNMAIIVPKGKRHGSVSEKGFKNISIGISDTMGSFFEDISVFYDTPDLEGMVLAKMILSHKDEKSNFLSLIVSAFLDLLMKAEAEKINSVDLALKKISQTLSTQFYDGSLSCGEILRQSGYAEDYIRACFKQKFSVTPTEFLRAHRLDYAIRLGEIYCGNISVERLTEMCGFMDSAHFSSCFKKRYGISPKKYMLNLKKR